MRNAVAVCASAWSLAGCQSMSPPQADKAEVGAAIHAWAAAFNSCDLNRVSAIYDKEALLWGTSAPNLISTSEGVNDYFKRVCAAKMPPKVAIVEQNVRVYGDTAVNAGTYDFTIFPEGKPRTVPARYSFTYRKKDGQWVIVEHHSSLKPAPAQ